MYSIIYQNTIIDVVKNPTFVKVLPSRHITFTDKVSANGIIGSDKKTIYGFEPLSLTEAKTVTLHEISENEFNRLVSLLNSGKRITANAEVLDRAITEVINNLSKACNDKITEGFSIRLSDGKKHSFKLTPEDQLNLISIENQLKSDQDKTFVYHETGELCKVFSHTDMAKVVKAFRQHVLYHTTYFNVAKHYVKSLVDIDKVTSFTYGTDISNMVKDNVIKQILKNGGRL